MNSKDRWTRRNMMKTSLAAVACLTAGNALGHSGDCRPTVYKGDGPFYPRVPIPAAFDLTSFPGKPGRATGQMLYVFGQILDDRCQGVPGVRVEIWQADPEGRYKHPNARDSDVLDPHFQYFAHVMSGEEGAYLFKTIVPGPYSFGSLNRAPHIHFKIKSPNHKLLSTEMYFAGDEEIMKGDQVFLAVPEDRRAPLIVQKQQPSAFPSLSLDFEEGALCCQFNLNLTPNTHKRES